MPSLEEGYYSNKLGIFYPIHYCIIVVKYIEVAEQTVGVEKR